MDAEYGGGDSRQPALHGPAGVEPAAHRSRPGRPGQHRAGPPAGAAVEPPGRVGDLHPARLPALVSEQDYIAAQNMSAPRGPPGPRPASICWPDCCAAPPAGGDWSQRGRMASLPTGAATATPAPPAPIRADRRTCTSVKRRSCPTWPRWPSCRLAITTRRGWTASHPTAHRTRTSRRTHRSPARHQRHLDIRHSYANCPHRHRRRPRRHGRPQSLTFTASARQRKEKGLSSRSARAGRRPGAGDGPGCPKTGGYGVLTCPRGT